jgi:transcriptional regulator with XRE-family HTH domain
MEANVDARVRRRLRELRAEQGLTLQQVAERANIDVSTLSRLESGKRRLALDHLPGLAAALGVTADDLLAQPLRMGAMTAWPLTRRGGAGGLQAYKLLVPFDGAEPPDELPVHEGHDWIYVLSGRLRLVLGEKDFVIEPGEAVEFSTWTPHWFGAVEGPVELIGIFGPQGQRLHVHG